MDFNSYINAIWGLIGAMSSTVVCLVTFQKLKRFKEEKVKELHSKYSAIKRLANDMDHNYSEILLILSGLTTKVLTKSEIQWFINEPGAFSKLEQYEKAGGRYCEINIKESEFSLTERVSTLKKRAIERFKIIGVGVGLLAVFSGMWGLIIYNVNTAHLFYLGLAAWFIYFLLILWGVNLFLGDINRALRLQGKPI
ncbi:UNVERIFIED_ORG: hypothetical protein DFO82_2662 [Idiomarina abyssalis]|uniref:hypothetical protein n=1 Tax=unclassified Idiomarina TaxID=2614829 RepID=UPI000E2CA893|nr:hypothetical protein [Idiomarina sp. 017G]TDO45142.1 hypothetical protein DEU30_11428 [Idiomarina sp. 017G]